jgi:hypothetical protein
MSTYNYYQKQVDRETMAEVRSCRRSTESLEHKKKRCSENKVLVKKSKREINNINDAVDTILSSIREIKDNKYAWSLGCDNTEQLLKEHINLPFNLINNLNQLSKLKNSLEPKWSVNDLSVLDFFRLLKCEELVNATLRVIDKESLSVDIKTIIKMIKRIHVGQLMNFHIPKDVLGRFCRNKYVKPTRPNTVRSCQSAHDIHIKFEIKLDPYFSKGSSKSVKLLGLLDVPQESRETSKKKKFISRHKFKL